MGNGGRVPEGELIALLLENTDWIRRRVETVHFINESTVERRVTLDVDTDVVRDLSWDVGVDVDTAPVPVARLAKELILDLDLRDACGAAVPVLTRSEDAAFAALALLSNHSVGEYIERSDREWVLRAVSRICGSFPSGRDRAIIERGAGGRLDAWVLTDGEVGNDPARRSRWHGYLAGHPQFRRDLLRQTTAFLLMTRVPLGRGVVVYKYRYEQPVSSDDVYGASREGWLERVGYRPFVGVLSVTVGWGASQHVRLIAPPGLFLTGATLVEERRRPQAEQFAPADGLDRPKASPYELRVTNRRAHLYTGAVSPGRYRVMFTMRCVAGGLWAVVPYVAAFTAAVLAVGLVTPALVVSVRRQSADAAVAVLLLAPSVMSAYALRPGEHELSARLARWPRRIVAVMVGCAVVAATQFVFAGDRPGLTRAVWGGGAAVSLAVCVYIAKVAGVLRRARREVGARETVTTPQYTRPLD